MKVEGCESDLSRYAIDGVVPKAVATPRSLSELSQMLRTVNEHKIPAVLRGGGTAIHIGNPPSSLHTVIDMTGMTDVVSHDIDNFTITVQAGMTLANLQEAVAPHRQFLAMNPPGRNQATLGGIVAADLSGPWRLAYGACRDLALGMKVVLADGGVVSFGGKTMKNVAGYDVHKLIIGSFGTLGAIAEVTFRLHALPQTRRTILASAARAADAFQVVRVATRIQPAAVWLFSPSAHAALGDCRQSDTDWLIAADLLGDTVAVEAQQRHFAATHRIMSCCDEIESERFWQAAVALLYPHPSFDAVLCRASLPPASVEEWVSQSAGGSPAHLIACPGTGRVWVAVPVDAAPTAVTSLRSSAAALGGSMLIEYAPSELKASLDVWGPPPAYMALLRQVKQLFDPSGILSPGCSIGGLS